MEDKIRCITIKELKTKDLCIEYIDYMYDYDTIEYLYGNMLNIIRREINTPEFNIDKYVQNSKFMKVFTKQKIRISPIVIEDYIKEWYCANTIDFDDDLHFTDKARSLLEQLAKEIHKNNQYYESCIFVGYIDLSNGFKKYIDKYL